MALGAAEQQAVDDGGEVWVTWSAAAVLVLLVGRLADGDALRLKRRLSGLVDRDVQELVVDCAGASWLSEAVVHALADVARLIGTDGAPDAQLVVVDPPGELGVRLRDRGIATRTNRISVVA